MPNKDAPDTTGRSNDDANASAKLMITGSVLVLLIIAVILVRIIPQATGKPAAPASTSDTRPAPASSSGPSAPRPPPVQVREYKPEGASYKCRLLINLTGKGRKEKWLAVEGGAHFIAQLDLAWTEHIIRNDGTELVMEREFHESASSLLLTPSEFGLTDKGEEAVKAIGTLVGTIGAYTGEPHTITTGGALCTIAPFLNSKKFEEYKERFPLLAPIVERELGEQMNKAPEVGKVQVARDIVGKIKGKKVTLTWRNDRLVEARYSSGEKLSAADEALASRIGAYVDMGIFPPGEIASGEQRTVSARQFCDFFNIDTEHGMRSTGQISMVRGNDDAPGRIASLKGKGSGSFSTPGMSGDFEITDIVAGFHYADNHRFLQSLTSQGKFAYGKISDPKNPLFGVSFNISPSLDSSYTCEAGIRR
ncbi:hypothetical protein OpiT1DRAFT_05994 [Opitutaceae bacterium TAV1]|nr:hypothetical protein OpiT1DRAFT_05994 [Opitutaceae bacterium TAV1]